MAVSISAINSITQQYFVPKLVDNVQNSMALLVQLKKKGKMTTVDGGTLINVPVSYARNTTVMNYSGTDVLDTSYQEKKTSLQFDWKQKNAAITISGLDMLKNAGAAKVIDHVKSETKLAERDMKDSFATGLYSSGSDAEDIVGARVFLSTSNTYGGIVQSAESWLQAKIDSTTTALSLAKMQERYEAAKIDDDKPGLITTTETQFNIFWALLQPQQRFVDADMAKSGFSALGFNGASVIEDSYVPSGYMVFWNLDHVELKSHSERPFPGEFVEFEKPINQDAMVAHLRWAGALCVDEVRKQAAMTALA